MSFVRAKEIPPKSGNWYDYEVMTVHNGGKVMQKVIQYLGKTGSSNQKPLIGDTGLRSNIMGGSTMPVSQNRPPQLSVSCKHCQSQAIMKFGTYKGEQLYWCKACHRKFANDGVIPKMKIPADKIASAMGMYYGGMSFDALQTQFKQDHGIDLSETTFWNWVKRFTHEAIKQSQDFKPVVGNEWVADETYMKLKGKTVYFWDIIDTRTNFLLASHVSFYRGAKDAKELFRLAEERAGKKPKIVKTDKLKSYIVAMEDAFGSDSKHVQGGPFKVIASGESTAAIERFHKTLEQRTKVFQKYQNIQNVRLLTAGWLVYYNFFKQNEGIGNIPPAQAMSKVVPFKDWKDVVVDKNVKPVTNYKVVLHPRKPTEIQKDKFIIPTIDVTLTPLKGQ
jgi:putative transposase